MASCIRQDELAIRQDELAIRQDELAIRQDELAIRQDELAIRQDELAFDLRAPPLPQPTALFAPTGQDPYSQGQRPWIGSGAGSAL